MKKIAINTTFGGFSLSYKAMERLIELGYTEKLWNEPGFGGYESKEDAIEQAKKYGFIDCDRDDKRLIQVIEEMGKKAGDDIEIIKIPDNHEYCIDEYDGLETIYHAEELFINGKRYKPLPPEPKEEK